MKRLTEHHVNKKMGVYMVCSGACDDFNCTDCEKFNEIVDRLAAYEDTGLDPEEIESIKSLCLGGEHYVLGFLPPPNAPLTLEELREMDGEPVWGAFLEGSGRYMIIQWHNSEFFKTFECGFLLLEEYGKTWMAYRRKPEEVTHGNSN